VLDNSLLENHIQFIFSSGGPLARETALAYRHKLGLSPTEVLGSTETGGVAWRRQNRECEGLWQKFPDVSLRANKDSGALEVKSPFCFTDDWYAMGDKVEIVSEKQFRLSGRLDRIVKLEEKRISLDNMEQTLEQSPDIEYAKIIDIPGKRTVLGVVAVLSPKGAQRLEQEGRRDFANSMKQYLSQYFERVTLPRKWRYVEEFPYNAQGKLTRQALLALFNGDL
jgi:acyl-coenzyme A synthetase/AMP-(fatty) acid ligase